MDKFSTVVIFLVFIGLCICASIFYKYVIIAGLILFAIGFFIFCLNCGWELANEIYFDYLKKYLNP